MSVPSLPDHALLVISILTAREKPLDILQNDLERLFGPLNETVGPLEFDFTKYYDKEMGPGIKRWIITAKKLVDPGRLAEIKLLTNEIETRYSREGRRQYNLDPGLLTLGNFVLATGKNNAHRIYLSKGIFGDLTLIFRRASYRPLEWTYPDYSESVLLEILNRIRESYKLQLEQQT